ncbi:hypothetical protein AQPE_0418 [Aquipluma nitroreducens]|uniref:37-kD nucleoid-associated bacterial protein n=1 Tax=Aquipluma nitroreducens TaxID=2010828 RepID=A0A5K7S3Y6_9BACT|nr:hypothetical protein [Aquipluma nitroreducens]BBE16281.1 hypothetical protein AQPE_0418 [Aquipluma nitroreducens]
MEIIFNRLYKIDVDTQSAAQEQFQEHDNLDNYIMDLLEKVTEEEGDRLYKYEEGSTTIKSILDDIIQGDNYDNYCSLLASRLLQEETVAQERYGHLHDIQKGMLIVSYVQMTATENKIIISKADYDTFIEEITGQIKSGLPLKKKIFKAFVANVSRGNVSKMVTYDMNAKVSKYWWKEFLELSVIRGDIENMETAFNAIQSDILNPLKKKYESDYIHLWNASIAYFRATGEFNLNHYRDEIIGNYVPFNNDIAIESLKEKCNKLPQKYGFDVRFEKVPSVISKKTEKTLVLSEEIELVMKHDVANLRKTFKPYEDEDGKYIMIQSEKGYNFAQKLRNE